MDTYFDAVAHIKEKVAEICQSLGIDGYDVAAERKLDAFRPRLIVASQMAGQVGASTASIPFELSLFSVDPSEGLSVLTELAKRNSGKTFESVVEDAEGNAKTYSVVERYLTPTIMDRDVQIGANHGVRIVQYANFDVISSVLDVKEISYKGIKVEFAQATINYVAQLSANNVSGENLMKSTATGAAISMSLTLPCQRNPLTTDVINVMKGAYGKNESFEITAYFGEGEEDAMKKTYLISAATINSVLGSLPSLQVSFVEFDKW